MKTLASRRPFQIEEGPASYSVTNIDGDVMSGDLAERKRVERDQDNALDAWPEHGLLGTQPNKNGKKW
jgi:hypothetical protein